ncbi:protein PHYTOCHROME KINASE SUBSTRATE 1-like [Tasmannia lanceolata]|uniref:protein PHYTOCHROME KINASE SUBSTRATE 1-like n=1 Tax=Tasmannia lanceolata TaxID=3420 RepID=UPI004062C31C
MGEKKTPISDKGKKKVPNREEKIKLTPQKTMGTLSPSTLLNLNKNGKIHTKRFFSGFGFNCSCSSKKSVDIEEKVRKIDKVGGGYKIEECFTFPVSNPLTGNLTVGRESQEEERRMSLEVFGSSLMGKRDMGLNLKRRLMMMSLDDGDSRRIKDIPASSTSGGGDDEDLPSDSSSDLFEIGSLSGITDPFLGRPPSDSVSSA